MENRDFFKWEMEMGDMKSSGEISFSTKEEKRKQEANWPELLKKLGAALINAAERWAQKEEGKESE